ncbi:crossover junction endodeoxyribonuclease RuvC [Candidatus Gottesmanbacteria bacterium]|nr:crossover junction endodeoxyribonuclease RuvC [Candidatus Gottesmanbacteria bacterium]
MIIIGIDPGVARVGWGIIEESKGTQKSLAYSCITTDKSDPLPDRLLQIHAKLQQLLIRYRPDCVAVEDLFFATNAKTAIAVGQARGVILLACVQAKVPVVSYTPLGVKLAITGSGKAEKQQMQRMVTRILHLTKIPTPDDTADALAIALTHAYSYKMKGKQ